MPQLSDIVVYTEIKQTKVPFAIKLISLSVLYGQKKGTSELYVGHRSEKGAE